LHCMDWWMNGTCRFWRSITGLHCTVLLTQHHRHRPRLPRKSHPRRKRRPRRHPAARGSRLPRDSRKNRHHQIARIRRPAVRIPKGRLLTSHRAGNPQGRQSQHAAADSNPTRRRGEGGRDAVCRRDQGVEATGAVQGQGNLRQWRNDQAQGEEDQIVVARVVVLWELYYTVLLVWKHMGALCTGSSAEQMEYPAFSVCQMTLLMSGAAREKWSCLMASQSTNSLRRVLITPQTTVSSHIPHATPSILSHDGAVCQVRHVSPEWSESLNYTSKTT
jgi:hypothetical protein